MTTEERFERIEHVTAGLAEDRRRDREEYTQLWRDLRDSQAATDRQTQALSIENAKMSAEFDRRMREQSAEFDRRMREQSAECARRSAEADDRIGNLTGAIAELIRHLPGAGKS